MSNIASRATNYADWYIDVILKAQLADYGPVKGAMVIRPRGYAIWERMRAILDTMFRQTGHENAYFPLLIPESFLQKEAEHVEGFAPEAAVVTHGGGAKLEEPLVIRPTSETIIWSMYKKWIQSYRDLPILINQWANVLRWEKRTRLFLRTSEFLWQEGHTAHETESQAREEARTILDLYRDFAENYLAVAVLTGIKTDSEKFAGAVETYTIEAMMQDKKALQMGTSHFLGQNFARAFDVSFQNRSGQLEHVWATSWGVSTRLIGALIMSHSDDAGLVLPPRIAPTEAVIIPIYKNDTKKRVLQFCDTIYQSIGSDIRTIFDNDDTNSPGWKFHEWELRGVPIRIECGPRDVEKDSVVLVRRDTGDKIYGVSSGEIKEKIVDLLQEIQTNLYQRSRELRQRNTVEIDNREELLDFVRNNRGFALVPWDGVSPLEQDIKEAKGTVRLIPFDKERQAREKSCILSGKSAKYIAVCSRNY